MKKMEKITTPELVKLMDYFHLTLNKESLEKYSTVNTKYETPMYHVELQSETRDQGIRCGYLFTSDVVDTLALDFLKTKEISIENTFYKTWEDVVNRDGLAIFIDQLTHYMHNYILGETWTPKPLFESDKDFNLNIDYSKYIVIRTCTMNELAGYCYDTLTSGIALKSDLVKIFVRMIINADMKFDMDKIKNREAKILYYDMTNTCPNRGEDIVKYLVYVATGKTMLVGDPETIQLIKFTEQYEKIYNIFTHLNDNQMKELARVFRRYKNILIAFKKSYRDIIPSEPIHRTSPSKVAPYINRLRKLSNKYHKPMGTGYWQDILSPTSLNKIKVAIATVRPYLVKDELDKLNNFQIIKLLNAITERIQMMTTGSKGDIFVIRNGKIYLSPERTIIDDKETKRYLLDLSTLLVTEFKERMIKKYGETIYIKYPKDIDIAAPTSEKNFVGRYPFGSSLSLTDKNAIIGIYWRGEWHVQDYDLSINTFDGHKYGWNGDWKEDDNSVIYSGDMTRAEPDACELFYCTKKCPDGIVKVNRYCGEDNSKFRFFISNENIQRQLDKRYDNWPAKNIYPMLNKQNIKFTEEIETPMRETQVGIILDSKLYFCNNITGNRQVSVGSDTNIEQIMKEIYTRKMTHMLSIKDIFELFGWVNYDTLSDKEKEIVDYIDLDNYSKADIINLFQ